MLVLRCPPRLIADRAAAEALFAGIAAEPVEVAAFAYLAANHRLLGMRHARSADATGVEVPVRDVAADALAFGADAVVMAHNHPSGDVTPSIGDRETTRRLVRALTPLGVRLIDHLVLAPGRAASFRAMGLL